MACSLLAQLQPILSRQKAVLQRHGGSWCEMTQHSMVRAAPGMGRGAGVVLGYSFWYSPTCVSIRFWVSLQSSHAQHLQHCLQA